MWDSFTGDVFYLDTNIVIFAIEEGNPWSELLRKLFEAIDEGAIRAVTSDLTLAEVLAKPMALEARDVIDKFDQLLAPESVLKVMPIDRPVLRLAAELQAKLGIKLMDSIHVATAKLNECDLFLTDDERLGRRIESELRWLRLSEVVDGK